MMQRHWPSWSSLPSPPLSPVFSSIFWAIFGQKPLRVHQWDVLESISIKKKEWTRSPYFFHYRLTSLDRYGPCDLDVENNKIFNTIFILKDAKIIDHYDKVKLVPFGEYVPLGYLLPLKKLVNGLTGFSFGDQPKKIINDSQPQKTPCIKFLFK